MARAWLSLGSNQAPERHLAAALDELARAFGPLDVSPAYRSAAVGFEGPAFVNLAAGLDTTLDPVALDAAVTRFFQVLDGFVAADERQFKANAIGGQITLKSLIPQWQEQDRLFGGNLQAALQDLMMTAQSVFFPNPAYQG